MKKYFFLAFFILTFSFNSFSQVSFSHSLGGGLYLNNSTGGFAAVYSPRINLLNFNDNATISIGTHFGLGFSGSSSSDGGSSGSIVLDIPVVLEFNFFHACNTENSSTFGFYFGGGFGYNQMAYTDFEGNAATSTVGIQLVGGIRSNVLGNKSLDLRASYLVDATGLNTGVFGIGLAYTFGMESDY